MATHSSILGWIISWTEKPGRLQSTGLQKSWRWLSDSATSFCSALHPFCAGFSHHALWSPNSHRILRVHIQVPGRNRSRDEGLLFVFFFPPVKALLFHVGGTSTQYPHPIHHSYVIWPHWTVRAFANSNSGRAHCLHEWGKSGILFELDWILIRQVQSLPQHEIWRQKCIFQFLYVPLQKTDDSRKAIESKSTTTKAKGTVNPGTWRRGGAGC